MNADIQARQAGSEPQRSFLVQAPAGSGKTELLIQRILALLACVDAPEEILALTFTRKAAAEMRQRVMRALSNAQICDAPPDTDHAHRTWSLAADALTHSATQGWNLLQHPARLRIMTIDAFAASLAHQLPLLSGFGGTPRTTTDAEPLYQQAVEHLFAMLDAASGTTETRALETLLLHLDHDVSKVGRMLCVMLGCREQWLPHIMAYGNDVDGLRAMLAENTRILIEDVLCHAAASLPAWLCEELPKLACFAADNLLIENPDDPMICLQHCSQWPDTDVAAWKALIGLLMTTANKPQWRKTVSKKQGFPTGKQYKPQKDRMLHILQRLPDDLLSTLDAVRHLPDTADMDASQWRVLKALFVVLKHSAAALLQVSAQRGAVDFTEVALRAGMALGDADAPGDALLSLDYRIKHVLVDEFQDTSAMQVGLLERLTAGWQQGDGRSLFMVGDPMQSIYSFRKAEVGLFLEAQQNGLPLPPCEMLTLSRNFRSGDAVVAWLNRAFLHVLPTQANVYTGEVPYTACIAARLTQGKVCLHWMEKADNDAEAAAIVRIVQEASSAGLNVGILARARPHLHTVMDALDHANIVYRAVDILPLGARYEVRDIRALLRALSHPADRESWAAVLHAPFVGLSLEDMHRLLAGDARCVWDIMHDTDCVSRLSSDGQTRLQHACDALSPYLLKQGRMDVRRVVEAAWIALGAPACLDAQALENARRVLQLLEDMDTDGRVMFDELDARMDRLYAEPDHAPEAGQVELMTMHGAKGLEWDVVILPGLGKRIKGSDKPLLAWMETPMNVDTSLLMAPIPAPGDADARFDLIRHTLKKKQVYETARLLYVACTRARDALHIFTHVREKDDDIMPDSSSMAALLWQSSDACYGADIHHVKTVDTELQIEPKPCQRMVLPYIQPQPADTVYGGHLLRPETDALLVEFSWVGMSARAVGIALHAGLHQIGTRGIESWQQEDTTQAVEMMYTLLQAEGLSGTHLNSAFAHCRNGLERSLNSTRAGWILSAKHTQAYAEWPLSVCMDGQVKHLVLDRSFVDQENTRWIVDYKTGAHEGGDVDAFLDREQIRYADQLEMYAQAVAHLDKRPIRLGLYFPMMDAWREWQRGDSS